MVVEADLESASRAWKALGPSLKKKETRALIPKENVPMETEKAWISVRQLSPGFGTMLTTGVSTAFPVGTVRPFSREIQSYVAGACLCVFSPEVGLEGPHSNLFGRVVLGRHGMGLSATV